MKTPFSSNSYFGPRMRDILDTLDRYTKTIFCHFFPFFGAVVFFWMSVAEDCFAVTLQEQLTSIQNLTYGPFIRVGVGIATIAAAAFAIAKHSVAMMFAVIGAGIGLSYYLGWLTSDSFITSGNAQ